MRRRHRFAYQHPTRTTLTHRPQIGDRTLPLNAAFYPPWPDDSLLVG
jgi:hypothetical protein